ncbi:transposase [Streptomyces sp. NPDC052069]|uniref:transposase n=1 Tax=Streptomyces sp. NPDC052069 TaxID=3154650 RepID=UPI00342520DD
MSERGPVPDLRRQFNTMMWWFRAGCPWRDVPKEYGSWSTFYRRWVTDRTMPWLADHRRLHPPLRTTLQLPGPSRAGSRAVLPQMPPPTHDAAHGPSRAPPAGASSSPPAEYPVPGSDADVRSTRSHVRVRELPGHWMGTGWSPGTAPAPIAESVVHAFRTIELRVVDRNVDRVLSFD